MASANAIAAIICHKEASRSSSYQEALALTEENKHVVLALTQALVDHPGRPLDAAEIDAVIAGPFARLPSKSAAVRGGQ